MSRRGLLARLERLERQVQLKQASRPDVSCPEFVIAPQVARAIVDAYERLRELLSRHRWHSFLSRLPKYGRNCEDIERPDIPAEEEVAACLAEHLRNVLCPPNYWAKQADTDRRLRDEQPSLSDRELVEVKARLIVFDASPDGAAWHKMMYLSHKTRTASIKPSLMNLTGTTPACR
jgi:hypothetical protein